MRNRSRNELKDSAVYGHETFMHICPVSVMQCLNGAIPKEIHKTYEIKIRTRLKLVPRLNY